METPPVQPEPNSTGIPSPPPPPPADRDVRMWCTLCHLSALLGLVVPSVGAVAGPLIVWLLKRNDAPAIDAHGKEALNFQISVFVYSWALGAVGILTTVLLVGFLFIAAAVVIGVVALALALLAAYKISNGQEYRYPLTIRFLT